jgi:hypothetical protein
VSRGSFATLLIISACGFIMGRRRNIVSARNDRAKSQRLLCHGFEQPQLRGTVDFINGPMRYAKLTGLPNGANWNDRIRSIEVGPARLQPYGPMVSLARRWSCVKIPYPTLPAALVGAIRSLDVRCTQAPASAP